MRLATSGTRTRAEVALHFGVQPKTVSRILGRSGVRPVYRERPLPGAARAPQWPASLSAGEWALLRALWSRGRSGTGDLVGAVQSEGVKPATARMLLYRLASRGLVRVAGRGPAGRGNPMSLWEAAVDLRSIVAARTQEFSRRDLGGLGDAVRHAIEVLQAELDATDSVREPQRESDGTARERRRERSVAHERPPRATPTQLFGT